MVDPVRSQSQSPTPITEGAPENHSSQRVESGGHFFSCDLTQMSGLIALIIGVGMIGLASALASGLYGGGTMYFAASGLMISALIPFTVAVCKLSGNSH